MIILFGFIPLQTGKLVEKCCYSMAAMASCTNTIEIKIELKIS